jgi:hypothetical protein
MVASVHGVEGPGPARPCTSHVPVGATVFYAQRPWARCGCQREIHTQIVDEQPIRYNKSRRGEILIDRTLISYLLGIGAGVEEEVTFKYCIQRSR